MKIYNERSSDATNLFSYFLPRNCTLKNRTWTWTDRWMHTRMDGETDRWTNGKMCKTSKMLGKNVGSADRQTMVLVSYDLETIFKEESNIKYDSED